MILYRDLIQWNLYTVVLKPLEHNGVLFCAKNNTAYERKEGRDTKGNKQLKDNRKNK